MSIMPELLARHTVENYRCSRCWGFLVMTWVVLEDGQLAKTEGGETLAEVKCRSVDEDLGFVSQYFVDKERIKDFDHAFEIKRDLVQMGIIPKEKAYADQKPN